MQNVGSCYCGNTYSTGLQYNRILDTHCGGVCGGETNMLPRRYCGGSYTNAVFSTAAIVEPTIQYKGCFKDNSRRDLKTYKGSGFKTETCRAACHRFKYFSMQAGTSCFCGDGFNTAPEYAQVADSQCGSVCAGEGSLSPDRYCGGSWLNAVYTTNITTTDGPELVPILYQGCYADDGHRDLKIHRGWMRTTEGCRAVCTRFKFFSLQANGYCFCGDAYATAAKYRKMPDSHCGGACAGESTLLPLRRCGGGWRNAVYSTAVTSIEQSLPDMDRQSKLPPSPPPHTHTHMHMLMYTPGTRDFTFLHIFWCMCDYVWHV
jgi:hypothetical protein